MWGRWSILFLQPRGLPTWPLRSEWLHMSLHISQSLPMLHASLNHLFLRVICWGLNCPSSMQPATRWLHVYRRQLWGRAGDVEPGSFLKTCVCAYWKSPQKDVILVVREQVCPPHVLSSFKHSLQVSVFFKHNYYFPKNCVHWQCILIIVFSVLKTEPPILTILRSCWSPEEQCCSEWQLQLPL